MRFSRVAIAPLKRLGQNFVKDPNICRKIVTLADVSRGDSVVEIGPGLGALTQELISAKAQVCAIELDKRLFEALITGLQTMFGMGFIYPGPGSDSHKTILCRTENMSTCRCLKITGEQSIYLINADALTINTLPIMPNRLVANLPYNIAIPLIMHFLVQFPSIQSATVMLQKEVADRLCAKQNSKLVGAITLKAAWFGKWKKVMNVPRHVFYPTPNVDSVVVGFKRWDTVHDGVKDRLQNSQKSYSKSEDELRRMTFSVIDTAFSGRRKMLRQSLKSLVRSEGFAETGIDETARAENLSINDFARLAEFCLSPQGARDQVIGADVHSIQHRQNR